MPGIAKEKTGLLTHLRITPVFHSPNDLKLKIATEVFINSLTH
jgi:hypothetical protein